MMPVIGKRLQLGLCLLAVTMAAVVVATRDIPKPKIYDGRTVRQWVCSLDNDEGHRKQREEASSALVQVAAPALAELERILAWRPDVWETFRNCGVRFRLFKPRDIPPLVLQNRACEAAYRLAEDANVDISTLVPHLRYRFTNGTYATYNSGRALARAGPTGIAVLTNYLFTGRLSVRDAAGLALGLERRRPEVRKALIHSANSDPVSMLRANALLYLTGSRGPSEQMIPVGMRFLKSGDGYERWAGASLLLDYRTIPEARSALEALISDPDERVRLVSEQVLKEKELTGANSEP